MKHIKLPRNEKCPAHGNEHRPKDVDISRSQLAELENHLLVDIRETYEVEQQKEKEKHIHIPMNDLLNAPEQLPKEQPIVLVCAAGIRSKFVASELNKKGYETYSLVGGI